MNTWIWAASIALSGWIIIKAIAAILMIRMATRDATGAELDEILDVLHQTRFVARPLVVIRRWWTRRGNA